MQAYPGQVRGGGGGGGGGGPAMQGKGGPLRAQGPGGAGAGAGAEAGAGAGMAVPTAQLKRTINSVDIGNAASSVEILKAHKRRRPTDRTIPPSLLAHDSGLLKLHAEYERLLELERTLDSTYTRKKTELLEESTSLKKTTHKKLRVRICNECTSQAWQEDTTAATEGSQHGGGEADKPDFETGKGVPSWTVKIEGKLVDLDGLPPPADPENELLPKFSQLVQHMAIDIQRPDGVYREPNLLNFAPATQNSPSEGFRFTRSGTSPVSLKIGLHLIQQPRKYKLSPELAGILGVREESKLGILTAMWSYIQKERLLESGAGQPEIDRRNIRCDDKLQKLFGASKLPFYEMSNLLNRFLSPPDPVVLEYTVDVTPDCAKTSTTYDILIELPDPSLRSSQTLLRSLAPHSAASQEVAKLDERIASAVGDIRTLAYQHSLFAKFSADPAGFMNEWMASQSLDLQDMLSPDPAKWGGSEADKYERRLRDSKWFAQDWVKNAVGLHVARQQAASAR